MGKVKTSGTIVIIGAGVIGLATAHHLHQRGYRTIVLDGKPAGAPGASTANAGWINPATVEPLPSPTAMKYGLRSFTDRRSPLYIRPRVSVSLLRWLLKFSAASRRTRFEAGRTALVQFAADASRDLIDFGRVVPIRINASESLNVFGAVDGARRADEDLSHLEDLGLRPSTRVLDRAESRRLEPLLSDRFGSALLVERDLQVEPASLLTALEQVVRASDGEVRRGVVVHEIAHASGAVTGVHTDDGTVLADGLVVAAGAWTPMVVRPLGTRLLMQPGKGYSVAVELDPAPGRVVALADAKVGIVPHGRSARLVGTMELSGVNERIDRRRVDAILGTAAGYIQQWQAPEVSGRAIAPSQRAGEIIVGMRPMFADGMPRIDRLPGFENAFVSTGHAMMGVTLAMASGRHLADFIDTGTRPSPLTPFALDR